MSRLETHSRDRALKVSGMPWQLIVGLTDVCSSSHDMRQQYGYKHSHLDRVESVDNVI